LSEESFVSVETGLVKKLSQDSKLQMTDVKMQLLTANWKDVI
jgi:hypothetical protein